MKYALLGLLAATVFSYVLLQVFDGGFATTFISSLVSTRLAYLASDAMEEDEINHILESLGN